jgi:hypothetical protein
MFGSSQPVFAWLPFEAGKNAAMIDRRAAYPHDCSRDACDAFMWWLRHSLRSRERSIECVNQATFAERI